MAYADRDLDWDEIETVSDTVMAECPECLNDGPHQAHGKHWDELECGSCYHRFPNPQS